MAIYKEKLLTSIKNHDPSLRDFVIAGLIGDRARFMGDCLELMLQFPGQTRLTLLSAMVEDDGQDLIPIFMTFIAKEANLLFAKSLVGLMAQFSHFEALTALKELAPKLHPEVKQAAVRAITKLNGKFLEQFYMDEFRAGRDNPKRIRHAAETMLAQPHPSYIPFLNEIILESEAAYRENGLFVLEGQADASSRPALQQLLASLVLEQQRNDPLCDFLLGEKAATITSVNEYMNALSMLAGWEAGLAEKLAAEILAKKTTTTLEWIDHSFGPFPRALREALHTYLAQKLISARADENKENRLSVAVSTLREVRENQMRTILHTLGRLAREFQLADLETAIETQLPSPAPCSTYRVAFHAGLRGARSIERLTAMLKQSRDRRLLGEIIAALNECEPRHQPEGLFALILALEDRALRRAAMELWAHCQPLEQQIERLLDHSNEELVADALQVIASQGLEPGYAALLARLPQQTEGATQILYLKALAAFPRGQTGQAVLPFSRLEHEPPVRQAAVQTLVRAGGPYRGALLFLGIASFPEEKRGEGITNFLRHVEQLSADELPPDLLEQAESWAELLNHKNARFRDGALGILARADWTGKLDPDWPSTLDGVLAAPGLQRPEGERERVRLLQTRARERLQQGSLKTLKEDRFRAELIMLMEAIETATHYEKVYALRKLNVIYREELIQAQDKQRLIYRIAQYFSQSEGDLAGLKLAVSIAAKIGAQSLLEQVEKLEHHEDAELARFARNARGLALRNAGLSREVGSILLLDPTVIMARTLGKNLEQMGFEVAVHTKPLEALQALVGQPYDLLLVAYHLGELTGVAFLREAKNRHILPERVIFMTSARNEDEQREMVVAGADAVLHKPFSMEKLYQRIREPGFFEEEEAEQD